MMEYKIESVEPGYVAVWQRRSSDETWSCVIGRLPDKEKDVWLRRQYVALIWESRLIEAAPAIEAYRERSRCVQELADAARWAKEHRDVHAMSVRIREECNRLLSGYGIDPDTVCDKWPAGRWDEAIKESVTMTDNMIVVSEIVNRTIGVD